MKAEEYADPAELKWDSPDPVWGIWQISNERIAMLSRKSQGQTVSGDRLWNSVCGFMDGFERRRDLCHRSNAKPTEYSGSVKG